MTTKNTLLTLLVVLILALGAWSLWKDKASTEKVVGCTKEAKVCPDGSVVGRQGASCEFAACPEVSSAWTFKEVAQEEGGQGPRTEISVNIGGKEYNLGSHVGSCKQIKDTSWPLLQDEKDGAICWWAGAGVEIGIFEENGKLLVKKGFLEEGDAENDGTRGNFELLFGL